MVRTRDNVNDKGFLAKPQSADELRNKVREFIGSINPETLIKIIGSFGHRKIRAAFTHEINHATPHYALHLRYARRHCVALQNHM